jgi:hypothetical protein
MVTGGYPVDGVNRSEIGQAHRKGKRQLLRDMRPDLPMGFVRAVERALAPDPADRYQTAGEFEAALVRSAGLDDRPEPHRPTPRHWLLASTAVLLIAITAWWMFSTRLDQPGPASGTTTPAGPALESSREAVPYSVKASFFNQRDRRDVKLAPGDRVALGDRLSLRIEASTAVHVYVVNTDERGESYLLFPLPGREPTNPLATTQAHRLPGQEEGRDVFWEVTSRGGREHFLVMASPTPLTAFEPMLRALPSPTPGRTVSAAPIPEGVIGLLRGVGGLVSADASKSTGATPAWFETADQLRGDVEIVRGPWIRRLTLENPVR